MNTLAFLAAEAPGIALTGSQVKIITEPTAFYNELCQRASAATRRITLSSLYLGTGEKEKRLVEAIRTNLNRGGRLKVNILLDYCRGTRDVRGESSCTMLQGLVAGNRKSCRISLYHTPTLRGFTRSVVPPKVNEVFGLQHIKVYIFDDSVMISGANLSQDYFTNRQDRCVLFESTPELSDFFDGLISRVSDFSLQMDENRNFSVRAGMTHPFEGPIGPFLAQAKNKICEFLTEKMQQQKLKYSTKDGIFQGGKNPQADTWVFPSVQMGLYDVHQDRSLIRQVMRPQHSTKFTPLLKFATGYFNPIQEDVDAILPNSDEAPRFKVLMAHPSANSFLGAPFPIGHIPDVYTYNAECMHRRVAQEGQAHRVDMAEYRRKGWTFHAKGLWYYPEGENSLPIASMIGSSNFGHRSLTRDLEAQVTIATINPDLRQQLHDESENMWKTSEKVSEETFKAPDRAYPRWIPYFAWLAKSFF